MAKITNVTTVPGSIRAGARKVAYVLIKDDGTKKSMTSDVSGDRDRVRKQLATLNGIDESDVSFDDHYDG